MGVWDFIGPRPDPTQGQPNLLSVGTLQGELEVVGIRTPSEIHTEVAGSTTSHTETEAIGPAFNVVTLSEGGPLSSGDDNPLNASIETDLSLPVYTHTRGKNATIGCITLACPLALDNALSRPATRLSSEIPNYKLKVQLAGTK